MKALERPFVFDILPLVVVAAGVQVVQLNKGAWLSPYMELIDFGRSAHNNQLNDKYF